MSALFRPLLLAALACLSPAASAADAAGIVGERTLAELDDCIKKKTPVMACVANAQAGADSCKADFCAAARLTTPLTAEQARAQLQQVASAMQKVADKSEVLGRPAKALQGNAEKSIAELRDGEKLDANDWDPASLANPSGDRARELLVAGCIQRGEAACATEAANLVALRASSLAFRAFIQRVNWAEVEKSAACSQLLRKRYDSYFSAARFQWPWELWINGLPFARGETPVMCEGFRDVPTRQWIVMHPALALRYSENAVQKTDAVLLIEVFGVRRWEWAGAQAANVRGGSVILSYSKQDDARSVGWGALVHLKDDVSFGLVRHKPEPGSNNKVSLILGYDFGTLLGQDKAAACKKLFDPDLCERVAK